MCECGCSDGTTVVRFPGAKRGEWYVLEVYPGCPDCGPLMALAVVRTNESDELFDLLYEDLPVAEFNERGDWTMRLLIPEALKSAFAEYTGVADDLDEPRFSFDDFIDRAGIRSAYAETQRREEEEQKRRAQQREEER